jgi:hypothetical protein
LELLQRLQGAWGHSGFGTIVEMPLGEWRDVVEFKVSLRAGGRAFMFLIGRALRRPAHRETRAQVIEEGEVQAPIVAAGDRYSARH